MFVFKFSYDKIRFRLLLIIFDAEKINHYIFHGSVCCLALRIDADKIKNFVKLFDDFSNNYSEKENIFRIFNKCYIHVRPNILDSETNLKDNFACSFHFNELKSIKNFIYYYECKCDLKNF